MILVRCEIPLEMVQKPKGIAHPEKSSGISTYSKKIKIKIKK